MKKIVRVDIDLNSGDIRQILKSIYQQLGTVQYLPYVSLDGLDDILHPQDFDKDSVVFCISGTSQGAHLTTEKRELLNLLREKQDAWKHDNKELVLIITPEDKS